MRATTYLQGAVLALLLSTPAVAQELVMRRPLPIKPGPGQTVPSEQTDNPVIEEHPDPTLTTCDNNPSSPNAVIVSAEWIQTGWRTIPSADGTCTTQQMGYACRATYSCQVDGENLTFTDLAPTSACPDVPQGGGMSCPPGWISVNYPDGQTCVPDEGTELPPIDYPPIDFPR